jgi:hypothetical protein
LAIAAWALGLAVSVVMCLAGCAGPSSGTRTSSGGRAASGPSGPSHPAEPPLGYRRPPSFLPTETVPVDRVVTASAAHPQLAVQGVGVRVELPSGRALATVTGPRVPPFVSPPPPVVTATFDVSLARVSGDVPVRLADFTITDQLGRSFHPDLVQHEKPPPAEVSAPHSASFEVTAVMPTGEGRLDWSPGGGRPLVSWDFVVEND